jgi:hypothetical protein
VPVPQLSDCQRNYWGEKQWSTAIVLAAKVRELNVPNKF